ncbi:40S ribosomal protein SA [Cricetulus griseus]|uniref:40S ribosomal protein SA n=1 Tax=Cricetulus griseus TaxID=10029 RepID=G3HDR6_CRIGR|nr:40S ribosomal protein SA [Cricetulus griseus]ERE86659.1 40S ribosomal protein SA [Cricetulus griseus]
MEDSFTVLELAIRAASKRFPNSAVRSLKGKSCYLHHSSQEDQKKLLLAASVIAAFENPKDASVTSPGNTGQWAVLKTTTATRAPQTADVITPGLFFHQIQAAFLGDSSSGD